MKRRGNRRHFFTLVELMVAMAILIIMMGYLFKFISGANSLWRGSTQRTDDFESAQLVFSILEQDFNASTIRSNIETKDSEQAMPWGFTYETANTDNLRLAFIGYPTESPDDLALIVYRYEKSILKSDGSKTASNKLYRKVFTNTADWYKYFTDLNVEIVDETTASNFGQVKEENSKKREANLAAYIRGRGMSGTELVAENLTDFQIKVDHDSDEYFFWNEKPEHLQIKMTFTNTSVATGEENVERSFQKTFFTR